LYKKSKQDKDVVCGNLNHPKQEPKLAKIEHNKINNDLSWKTSLLKGRKPPPTLRRISPNFTNFK